MSFVGRRADTNGRRVISELRIVRLGRALPVLIWGICLAPFAKIFLFSEDPNHFTYYGRLVPHEGRLAIVTDAERDAVDVEVPITNGADADGEDVWS